MNEKRANHPVSSCRLCAFEIQIYVNANKTKNTKAAHSKNKVYNLNQVNRNPDPGVSSRHRTLEKQIQCIVIIQWQVRTRLVLDPDPGSRRSAFD